MGDDGKRHRRVMADVLSRQEREVSDGDIRPDPCPKCGNPSRLFTPNAQRAPYASPRRYEAAWQCTTCGAPVVAPRPDAGLGRRRAVAGQGHRTRRPSKEDSWRQLPCPRRHVHPSGRHSPSRRAGASANRSTETMWAPPVSGVTLDATEIPQSPKRCWKLPLKICSIADASAPACCRAAC